MHIRQIGSFLCWNCFHRIRSVRFFVGNGLANGDIPESAPADWAFMAFMAVRWVGSNGVSGGKGVLGCPRRSVNGL